MIAYIRSRGWSSAIFLVSLAIFVPALIIPRSGDDLTVRQLVLFASLAVMLFSGVWLIMRSDDLRRLQRLRSGVGVLARWTVDRARWERFRAHSAEWDQQKGLEPNRVDLTQEAGDAGIEVVVSRDGVLVGTDFHALEIDVRITVRAEWMEFYQTIHNPNGSPLRIALRLPLQPGQEHLAAEVQQSYQRVLDSKKGDKRPLIYIALFCFVGLPAVAALVYFVARLTGWVE